MINKGVIPTEYMQKLNVELLLPHNEKYYLECLEYIKEMASLQKNISKNEIINLVLLQIQETQLDGKRAEQRLGSDPIVFVQNIIEERYRLLPSNIFLDKYQFPLYAFSLYLIAYAFFIFFLGAWLQYTVSETINIQVHFSLLGLLAGFFSVTMAFLCLFYNRQKLKLLHLSQNKFFILRERLNYLWIGSSFIIPFFFFSKQIMIISIKLWMLFLIGGIGIGVGTSALYCYKHIT